MEVSAHPLRCAQTKTSHPPPPSNAGGVATLSHPLPLGRVQIRGQLVPPAHPFPSDARLVLDHFSPPVGVRHPDLATTPLGLAEVSQLLITQAFASWLSFAGWGTLSNLAPTNFAPSGANCPWGVPFASQALGPFAFLSFVSPWLLCSQYPQPTQSPTRQAATIPASSSAVPLLTYAGNSSAPLQQLASAAGLTVTASEDHLDAVSLFASQRDIDLGEGDRSESDDRFLRPEDSISQVGSTVPST